VELHGGQFHLKSRPREGTEVIITLPATRVMDTLPAEDVEEAPPAPEPKPARPVSRAA
jgi:two-component system cell cycle sensor histidine kinase PleC